MKILKDIFEKLPLSIWTGILGGVTYLIWVRLAVYSVFFPSHLPFISNDNFFSRAIHFIILTPIIIGDNIGYKLLGLLLFVIAGLSLGIKLQDPDRKERRKFILIILGIVAVTFCTCWAILLTILSYWSD